jgi:hypothetical protein
MSSCSQYLEALTMAEIHRTLAALALGTALLAGPAVGQQSASVSLTHTVSVTVPPRVKVQIGAAPAAQAVPGSAAALSVSINATQSWTLSIGSTRSRVQWATDQASGFSGVTPEAATIASGGISQRPADATLYLRSVAPTGSPDGRGDTIILTVVAP